MTKLRKFLTLEMAKKMATAAERTAIEKNLTIVISIIDDGGNLKYFQRMDGTSYGSVRVSQLKAKTAASLPFSSKALGERSASLPANPYAAIPDMLPLGGGLPIITQDRQHLGGIGISGANPELDELCAQAALAAVAAELK